MTHGNEVSAAETSEMSAAETMVRMISGFWVSRAVHAAAELRLADLLEEGPKTADELAGATGTHAASLYRLLRALASVGVFAEGDGGRFRLTPLADTLRTNAPVSLRAFAASELGEVHYPAWGELLHSVRTGGVAFDRVFGAPCWDYFDRHPETARGFNDSMTDLTRLVEPAVLEAYDFSGFETLVDVGGGHGSLLVAVLKKHEGLRGVLFDSPQVVAGARRRMSAEGLAGRCEIIGGDFFETFPAGGSAYVMKHIIHDWDDPKAGALLRNCRRAMPEGGRLLLVEQVLPEGNAPSLGKFSDLIMMVMNGGRERTAAEFRALLSAAGLKVERIIQTRSPMCVVEAVAA